MKEEGNSKGAILSYAWGKVRELYALLLFDLGSTHNFISHELALKLGILALKLGIHDFEMGDVFQANGAFKGQSILVTLLI